MHAAIMFADALKFTALKIERVANGKKRPLLITTGEERHALENAFKDFRLALPDEIRDATPSEVDMDSWALFTRLRANQIRVEVTERPAGKLRPIILSIEEAVKMPIELVLDRKKIPDGSKVTLNSREKSSLTVDYRDFLASVEPGKSKSLRLQPSELNPLNIVRLLRRHNHHVRVRAIDNPARSREPLGNTETNQATNLQTNKSNPRVVVRTVTDDGLSVHLDGLNLHSEKVIEGMVKSGKAFRFPREDYRTIHMAMQKPWRLREDNVLSCYLELRKVGVFKQEIPEKDVADISRSSPKTTKPKSARELLGDVNFTRYQRLDSGIYAFSTENRQSQKRVSKYLKSLRDDLNDIGKGSIVRAMVSAISSIEKEANAAAVKLEKVTTKRRALADAIKDNRTTQAKATRQFESMYASFCAVTNVQPSIKSRIDALMAKAVEVNNRYREIIIEQKSKGKAAEVRNAKPVRPRNADKAIDRNAKNPVGGKQEKLTAERKLRAIKEHEAIARLVIGKHTVTPEIPVGVSPDTPLFMADLYQMSDIDLAKILVSSSCSQLCRFTRPQRIALFEQSRFYDLRPGQQIGPMASYMYSIGQFLTLRKAGWLPTPELFDRCERLFGDEISFSALLTLSDDDLATAVLLTHSPKLVLSEDERREIVDTYNFLYKNARQYDAADILGKKVNLLQAYQLIRYHGLEVAFEKELHIEPQQEVGAIAAVMR